MAYNRGMNALDILLPFGFPPPDTARDLIRECRTPALATLLSRGAGDAGTRAVDPFARALAHENWLAQRFGLAAANSGAGDSSPPLAHAAMRALGLPAADGHWFILHPTHTHVARDHLVLIDMRQLALDDGDARTLFEAAASLCDEIGKTLLYGNAGTWFIRADDWPALRTATPDAASGRNIDIWMPQGEGDRAWRKLQNEIQMHWFTLPLNEAREARGLKPVNSLWLWGGADAGAPASASAERYDRAFNLSGWTRLFGQFAAAASVAAGPTELIDAPGARGLLLLDALTEAALTDEWGYWLEGVETLERDWFAPLLAALRAGRLQRLNLILSGQDRIAEIAVSRNSLRKFWIKPGLQRLAS
ncbi:MAG: signal peptide protein [Herbaspirillum sp.]|jgi:hypothetical protein|nr:signal peptide protein [Herbaspirillum sp.]